MIPQRFIFLAAASFFAVALYTLLLRDKMPNGLRPTAFHDLSWGTEIMNAGIADVLHDLYGPLIPPLETSLWIDSEGRQFYNTENPSWTEPLKSDVLILDVDNRPGRRKGEMGFPGYLDFNKANRITAGMLNHFMYAKLHGYDYQFVRPTFQINRHPTWHKVPAILEGLKTHRVVVFADSDAIFVNMQLPIEWLMSHWNVTNDYPLALSTDPPNARQNTDMWGRPNINTGFIIAQQHEMTDELFDVWMDCIDGKRYPQCTRYNARFPHEQGALSSFVRYDYGNYIKELPCDEANGFPGAVIAPLCNGTLIRHNWHRKGKTHQYMVNQLARVMFGQLHRHYIENEAAFLNADTEPPEGWEVRYTTVSQVPVPTSWTYPG